MSTKKGRETQGARKQTRRKTAARGGLERSPTPDETTKVDWFNRDGWLLEVAVMLLVGKEPHPWLDYPIPATVVSSMLEEFPALRKRLQNVMVDESGWSDQYFAVYSAALNAIASGTLHATEVIADLTVFDIPGLDGRDSDRHYFANRVDVLRWAEACGCAIPKTPEPRPGTAAGDTLVRGRWPGTLDELDAALIAASTELAEFVGPTGFKFVIARDLRVVSDAIHEHLTRRWMVADIPPKGLATGTEREPDPDFQGWPWAEVEGRKAPNDVSMVITRGQPYRADMEPYLDGLLAVLRARRVDGQARRIRGEGRTG